MSTVNLFLFLYFARLFTRCLVFPIGLKSKIARNEYKLHGRSVVYGRYYGSTPNVHFTSNNNNNSNKNNNNTSKTTENSHHHTQCKKSRYLLLMSFVYLFTEMKEKPHCCCFFLLYIIVACLELRNADSM